MPRPGTRTSDAFRSHHHPDRPFDAVTFYQADCLDVFASLPSTPPSRSSSRRRPTTSASSTGPTTTRCPARQYLQWTDAWTAAAARVSRAAGVAVPEPGRQADRSLDGDGHRAGGADAPAAPEHDPLDQVDRHRPGLRPALAAGSGARPGGRALQADQQPAVPERLPRVRLSFHAGRPHAARSPRASASSIRTRRISPGGAPAARTGGAAATPGSFPTTPSRAATAIDRIPPPSRRGSPSTACACTASSGCTRRWIRSSASGSSAVAAARLDVDFVGVEIDEHYLAAGIQRVNDELNERGLFESPAGRRRRRPGPHARPEPGEPIRGHRVRVLADVPAADRTSGQRRGLRIRLRRPMRHRRPPPPPPASSSVAVSSITDGDTLRFSPAIEGIAILRLLHVDTAGDRRRCHGAIRRASSCSGSRRPRTVLRIETEQMRIDPFGRLLGHAIRDDGLDMNREQLRLGQAVLFVIWPNVGRFEDYRAAEIEAQTGRTRRLEPSAPLTELPFEYRLRIDRRRRRSGRSATSSPAATSTAPDYRRVRRQQPGVLQQHDGRGGCGLSAMSAERHGRLQPDVLRGRAVSAVQRNARV